VSQLDSLLARSRSPGTFVEKSSFTLARSKAVEKMREYSLRDPDQAVLELVQAAVFAGARWIAVDANSESLVVAWVGGKTVSRAQLEDVFDYLFADQGQQETRYLMQAAVGVNALLQKKPRRVRIESGDGTPGGTARMDLDRHGRGDVGTSEDPLPGTYLYCERGTSWFGRLTSADPSARQTGLIEERCLYTPTPILLNGSAPFGYRSSQTVQLFGVQRAASIEGNGRRGALGLPQNGVEPGIRIVVGGVWITTRRPRELGPKLVGVLGDDRLRKTADMADIVEDARWIDMLHDVQPIATQLLRTQHGSTYQPPRLPPRVAESSAPAALDEPALEALPDRVVQLAPREPVALTALQTMAETDPLFWVEEDVVEGLTRVCDPVSFPYRVLVLSPGQARTVEATLGENGPRLSRLTNPEDVSFVQHAMERRHGVHAVRVEAEVHLSGERTPRVIPLALRLHVDGPPPQWDTSAGEGDVPVALLREERTLTTGRVDLPLQHVSVVADLTDVPVEPSRRLWEALRHAIQREAWRLLPSDSATEDPWRRRLEMTLLADHARPHLVREADGELHVRIHFPAAWRSVAPRLLQTPLAQVQGGTLSLQDLARLQGTDELRWLVDPDERRTLEELEARFGYGHVLVPADLQIPLAAVGRAVDSWTPRSGTDLADPSLDELLLVFPALAEPEPPEGWQALPRLGPGIARWLRVGDEVPATPGSLADGAGALLQLLVAHEHGDWQTRAEHLTRDRAAALGRLAALRLAVLTERLGEVRLPATRGPARPARAWLTDPDVRFAARAGASTDEGSVVPVYLDELQVLRTALAPESPPLHLLLDDHPELWDHSHEGEGWLVTLPVQHAGLRGWLGLRAPFDPTPGVLLETSERLVVLPGFTSRVPCHGLLHLTGSPHLSRAQTELLHFSGMQLYQQLLRRLDEDLPPPAVRAARAYAARFAQRAWVRQKGLGPGLARNLAQRVPVDQPDGRPWGTLVDWLDAEPGARPPPPDGAESTPTPARTGQVSDLQDLDDTWGFITGPVERALQAQLPGVRCALVAAEQGSVLSVADASDTSRCRLALVRTPLVERALHGDARARGLLLVEAARVALAWAERAQLHLDPLALQQAILATRLVR